MKEMSPLLYLPLSPPFLPTGFLPHSLHLPDLKAPFFYLSSLSPYLTLRRRFDCLRFLFLYLTDFLLFHFRYVPSLHSLHFPDLKSPFIYLSPLPPVLMFLRRFDCLL